MKTKTTPAISPVMQQVSRYIAAAPKKALPKAVLEKTKHHVLDTLAAMVSGSRLLPGRKAISYAKTLGGNKESVIAGSRIVTTAATAALANGMLGHADARAFALPSGLRHRTGGARHGRTRTRQR